ncbi:hypothetical protein BBO99_00001903 [Phytophthora kernoviae]|uniref:Amino acid transporter transmembrane domain-containing protein n=1 Tax=Phytophthora kernoviae TaxID=325452 RepID=A0A3R7HM42_9STRA|nr:hypothetical protein BBI17_001760 [Phytophthora kernoviae]RLN83652.1 hypothetical protein BBO99_00001903 [Phytophthora kernoviae]
MAVGQTLIPGASETRRSAFFTLEDAKISFSIICCVCGIGTLAMPSNFARAGPVYGTIAMVLMAFANIYATVALSRVILVAPPSVKTFSDVGEWVLGKTGRYLVNVSQLLVCLLLPCAFLVLGSTLLDVLFPDSFSQIFWIIFVAITAIPACLIPTLKAAAMVAFIGCMGTIIADVVGVSVLEWEMRGHPSAPAPDVTLHQILTAFGNLSLAYGVAVLIPDLQRQHSQPKRMPRVIAVSLGIGSAFFLAVAIAGYVAGGCQLSANLLFSIVNISDPSSPSSLGFVPDHGAVIMAYLFMHLHVVIVLSTVLQPPFYMAERLILGMHKSESVTVADNVQEKAEDNDGWEELREKMSSSVPVPHSDRRDAADLESNLDSTTETLSQSAKREQVEKDHDDAQMSDYSGARNIIRYVTLRIVIMALLVAAAIGFRDHFLDLVDFTGASAITVCCLVLPLVFYLKVFWNDLPIYERVIASIIIVVCTIVGCYVMVYAGKNLFNPDSGGATFPYCPAEYQSEPYYSRAFLTIEDAKTIFNIVCCFFGIGTLSMPSNFARAGPVYATIAMMLMAFANIYATVALSKVMLVAPASVKTFTDVGDWVFGKTGRYLVIVSQLLVCLLLPCAFLVLGSTLLDVLFPDSFSQIFWIIFMAITVIPSCLIPTLKAAASIAFVGCLGTLIADVIGVSILEWEMRGHPSIPTPDITLHQVLTTLGNLSLAYGASVVVPDLQRQHSEPKRMPRIILVSLGGGSAFFLAVAIAGYVAGGCQLSGNLLFSIVNTSNPYLASALGFIPNRGAVIMAYLFMQVHITIAFSTVIQPPFYLAERFILGMHKSSMEESHVRAGGVGELQEKLSSASAASPVVNSEPLTTTDLEINYVSANEQGRVLTADEERKNKEEQELSEYSGAGTVMRYVTLRICIIAALVVVSIGLRDHFLDLVDFTGASAITVCCLALPIVFYLKVFWKTLPIYERVAAVLVIIICSVVGCYVMIYAGKNLFNPDTETAMFPYCKAENQIEPYYVRNTTIAN